MNEAEFEKVYQKFYVELIKKIYKNFSFGEDIYPSAKGRQQIINDCLSIKNCTCRFIDLIACDCIIPLNENDRLYPFEKGKPFSNKDFFRLVEPSYIIPYLVYGGFAYELSAKLKTNPDFLLQVEYKIDLPIDFTGRGNNYFWYTQISRVLTLDKNNQLISHINIYEKNGRFKIINGRPQNKFVEATIFANNQFHKAFQDEFERKFCEFLYQHVFTATEIRIINGEISGEKAYEHHKQIGKKMTKYTGDRFIDIMYVRDYLKSIGFFEIAA